MTSPKDAGSRGYPMELLAGIKRTLSWKFPAEKWFMVLAPDGRTALVTDHGWPSGVSSGTFEKLP